MCLRAMLLVSQLLGAVAASPQPQDVLLNPSFEHVAEDSGLPVDWSAWHTPSAAAYSLADARTGVACVAIVDNGPDVSHGLRSQPVKIEPGNTYRASAWVKILRLEAGGFAVYLEFWQGSQRIADYARSLSQAEDWSQITVENPAPPNAEAATVLVYGSSATVGHALFDDAALERVH
jgi:hypothetical protein